MRNSRTPLLLDGEFPPYVNRAGFTVEPRSSVNPAEAVNYAKVALTMPGFIAFWTRRTAPAGQERVQYATPLPERYNLAHVYARAEAQMNDNHSHGRRPLA